MAALVWEKATLMALMRDLYIRKFGYNSRPATFDDFWNLYWPEEDE